MRTRTSRKQTFIWSRLALVDKVQLTPTPSGFQHLCFRNLHVTLLQEVELTWPGMLLLAPLYMLGSVLLQVAPYP